MDRQTKQEPSRRDFPRVREVLPVRFEFVRWTETDPVAQVGSATTSVDLSVSGLGLAEVPTLNQALIRQLLSGLKKVRLSIALKNGVTVNVFARLIWAGLSKGSTLLAGRAGFNFIDITPDTFGVLKTYVEARLGQVPERG